MNRSLEAASFAVTPDDARMRGPRSERIDDRAIHGAVGDDDQRRTRGPVDEGARVRGLADRRPRSSAARVRIALSDRVAGEHAADGLTAWLYDADGEDRKVTPDRRLVESLKPDQLLWIDLPHRDREVLEHLGGALDLRPTTVEALGKSVTRASLHRFDHYIHLTLQAVEEENGETVHREIDLVAGQNWVVTTHEGAVRAFETFVDQVRGDSRIGRLDAAAFMAALVDSQLSSYFGVVEGIEREIDRLDERALRTDDALLLGDIVRLRRRVAMLRRTLAPHREAFAPLARPDFELHGEIGRVWPGLVERLERTMDAVENVRELLVGTFDIHMGRLAQRTNEVMKVLTIVSAILLPSVVLAGIMGMNFKLAFFDAAANFWLVIGTMLVMAVAILGVARWRRWI